MGKDEIRLTNESLVKDRMIQLTDYLFEKGFTVSKPMMLAAAEFFVGIEVAVFQQGVDYGRANPREGSDGA